METWTIGRLLDTAAGYLKEKGSPSARLDTELLLADSLGLERIQLYTQYDRPLTPDEVTAFRALIARRAAREPVAYIRGKAHFRHLTLEVRAGVLIPRPETEELVELALETLRLRPPWGEIAAAVAPGQRPQEGFGAPTIVDVGTGSGCIALSLAQEAGVRVLAVDASEEALGVTRANSEALGLSDRVLCSHGDLLAGVAAGSLDLVVSNPPYVRAGDIPGLEPDVRAYEPLAALDGGADGLDVYRRLVPQASRALRPGGTLLLEVGEDQAEAVCGLAQEAGFALVAIHKDMSRKDRMVAATLPGAFGLAVSDLEGAVAAAPRAGAPAPLPAHEAAAPASAPSVGSAAVPAADLAVSPAAQVLRRALDAGAAIGLPTDTVYGIAARWDSEAGVRRLFAAKQRSPEQPVQVLFPSVGSIRASLPDLEESAGRVLEALLPGPYTFVVATQVPRPEHVGTADSLGVRVPDHPGLLRLLAAVDVPVAATSANLSGQPAPATVAEVDPLVLAHCSVAVVAAAGEPAAAGVASTVVDLRPLAAGGDALVLREGAVSADDALRLIRACAG